MNKALWRRAGLAMLVGILIGVLVNEVTFAFLRAESRPPGTIELVIPAGTADLVAAGQQPPAIPGSMSFVAGDTLVVRNEDAADHQLGPLWVPAGSQASLKLETTGSFADACSFQASRTFDLTVHPALTFGVRFQGIFLSGVPLGILLALYAAIAWPLKPRQTPAA
jgi:hypothetical protein